MAVFHYSSYWGTWSRRLAVVGHNIIELNLTPIPCCHDSTWDKNVAPELIRVHFTADSRGDITTNKLPDSVREAMFENLGPIKARELLECDYTGEVPPVNIIKAHGSIRQNTGGIPWHAIRWADMEIQMEEADRARNNR